MREIEAGIGFVMVIESLIVTTGVAAFLAYQNWSLGLSSAVPQQPSAKAHWLASQCLQTIKDEVSGSKVVRLESSRLQFENAASLVTFDSREGKLYVSRDGGSEKVMHDLGPSGTVEFKQLSPTAIFAKIRATAEQEAQHEVGVRLEVRPS